MGSAETLVGTERQKSKQGLWKSTRHGKPALSIYWKFLEKLPCVAFGCEEIKVLPDRLEMSGEVTPGCQDQVLDDAKQLVRNMVEHDFHIRAYMATGRIGMRMTYAVWFDPHFGDERKYMITVTLCDRGLRLPANEMLLRE